MVENKSLTNTAVCIALLAEHHKVNILSTCLTLLSAGTIVLASLFEPLGVMALILLISILVLGVAQLFIAIRVGFDHQLLLSVSHTSDNFNDLLATEKEFMLLDRILVALKLVKNEPSNRVLNDRLLGCIQLFKQQSILCGLQVVLIVSVPLLV
ncbi:hypothetical protein [Shewanella gelidii]|uniref:Uncharacterized protein n=1 Tax=Shewanella gelidii TaxID=1642821 RepID=A0A917JVX9_9GAMM|nr:hypothetical protein [Shewanella gelidii]MCL1098315.1 hypothetical protein [Shewanella gelidii]GGI84319.1 hypothetical protein GCM10009332_21950 [Shewanella gelidii]